MMKMPKYFWRLKPYQHLTTLKAAPDASKRYILPSRFTLLHLNIEPHLNNT